MLKPASVNLGYILGISIRGQCSWRYFSLHHFCFLRCCRLQPPCRSQDGVETIEPAKKHAQGDSIMPSPIAPRCWAMQNGFHRVHVVIFIVNIALYLPNHPQSTHKIPRSLIKLACSLSLKSFALCSLYCFLALRSSLNLNYWLCFCKHEGIHICCSIAWTAPTWQGMSSRSPATSKSIQS